MRLATKVVAIGLLGLAMLLFGRAGAAPGDQAGWSARAEGLVLARCGICHSTDLIAQQRLDRSRWQATVGKMVHWGAELSEEEAALVVEFLAERFHPAASASVTLSEIGAAEPLQTEPPSMQERPNGVAQQGAALFANNCQACHGAGAGGGFGPKLAGNPILHLETAFWETVLYGRGPMPAWEHTLSRQDIADILAWLKTL
ncbi:MAG: c-type cytochrome [Nitrospirae bacterium]|nr:c-type cytochrome [Nitrospirota bacterium]